MSLPSGAYIAIEGSIGVGKTSLAKIIHEQKNAELILEQPDSNPFLPDFYENRSMWALQTQLSFLLSRHRQQLLLKQKSFFHDISVTDYIFDKDRLFARLNLSDRDFELYNRISKGLVQDIPTPDLVVWLKSSPERLLTQIRIRDVPYERNIKLDYLTDITEAYNRLFTSWEKCSLLKVDCTKVDFISNEIHQNKLIDTIFDMPEKIYEFELEA